MSTMREFEETSTLFGGNAPFIEDQYEIYLGNPGAVSPDWRAYFDTLRDGARDVPQAPVVESFIQLAKNRRLAAPMVDAAAMQKQVLVLRLISKYRTLGVFQANLDPLQRAERPYIADLDLASYGFTEGDLNSEFDVGSYKGAPGGASRMRLRDLIAALQDTYCRTFGSEYMYIGDTAQKRFIQQRLEPLR
jgi:2-oxoglutarate dehydrogenase E1 component